MLANAIFVFLFIITDEEKYVYNNFLYISKQYQWEMSLPSITNDFLFYLIPLALNFIFKHFLLAVPWKILMTFIHNFFVTLLYISQTTYSYISLLTKYFNEDLTAHLHWYKYMEYLKRADLEAQYSVTSSLWPRGEMGRNFMHWKASYSQTRSFHMPCLSSATTAYRLL